MTKPLNVRTAMQSGDTESLRTLGRAGGIASAKARRDRREHEEVFVLRNAERHEQEERERRESANEDICPPD